jgi:hypothetical protein
MRPLRNGDLTDAAELIDSAQGCAKLMAECCAAKDAEIARLQEQVRYEQQRNEENVALNDYEMKRLREDLAHENKAIVEREFEIIRLLEAIKRESKKHTSGEAGVSCCCDLCDITREGE